MKRLAILLPLLVACGHQQKQNVEIKPIVSNQIERSSQHSQSSSQVKIEKLTIEKIKPLVDKLIGFVDQSHRHYFQVKSQMNEMKVELKNDLTSLFGDERSSSGRQAITGASYIVSSQIVNDKIKYVTRYAQSPTGDKDIKEIGQNIITYLNKDEYSYLNKEVSAKITISEDGQSATIELDNPQWYQ